MKALICDLGGALVDSVYAHVLACQAALAEAGMPIEGWRLHRPMGMSGGLSKRAAMRELGRTISLPRLTALDLAAKEYAAAAVSASQARAKAPTQRTGRPGGFRLARSVREVVGERVIYPSNLR